jgi:hypothetical protein
MADRRQQATGAALVGGGGALAATPGAVNRGRSALVRRKMHAASGNLGGLDPEGKPVDPFLLSGKRGGKLPEGGRRPPPREAAIGRYNTVREPFYAKLAKPGIGARGARALRFGGAGVALVGAGQMIGGSGHGKREVKKADELAISPQFGVGIPPTRVDPISPLAMSASSGIMANFLVGASGKSLTRRQKKAIRRGAYGFAGARGMLYSPLGFGRSNSA